MKNLEATDAPPRERFFLQLSSDDPLTCLVFERETGNMVGSFRLWSEGSMAERLGIEWIDDPALMHDIWRWRVDATDGGNNAEGYFA